MSMWARTWAHTWARTCGRRNLDVISSAECLRSRSRRRSGRRQRRPLRASSGRPRSWASERGRCSLATDCGLTVRVWPKGLRATRIDHFQFLLLKLVLTCLQQLFLAIQAMAFNRSYPTRRGSHSARRDANNHRSAAAGAAAAAERQSCGREVLEVIIQPSDRTIGPPMKLVVHLQPQWGPKGVERFQSFVPCRAASESTTHPHSYC